MFLRRRSRSCSYANLLFLPQIKYINQLSPNNLHPNRLHCLLPNIYTIASNFPFKLSIIIFPPMKERITRIMHRSLPGHSSGSKRKGDQQLETVLANSKIYQEQSSLERLIEEFPLLDALLNELQTPGEKSKSKPVVAPRGPLTKIQQLKMVYKNYYPVHEDPQELSRIVSAMRAGALTSRPDFYLQAVHEQYTRLGGSRSVCELQEKLQADLIYLIRRDNERSQHERQKYY